MTSNITDWCRTEYTAPEVTTGLYLTVDGLSTIAAILVWVHFIRLFNSEQLTGATRTRILRNVALMSVPPTLIVINGCIRVITMTSMCQSLLMTITMCLLHLSWSLSSYFLYSHTVEIVEKTSLKTNTDLKLKFLKLYIILNSSSQFIILGAFHVLIYVLKNPELIRYYAIFMVVYVCTHVIPIGASHRILNIVKKHHEESLKLGATDKEQSRIAGLVTKVASMRNTFVGTILYLYNIIFIVRPDWSNYYLIMMFMIGVLSALGCFTIFPYTKTVEESTSTTSHSMNTQAGSAVSDRQTGGLSVNSLSTGSSS